MKAEHRKELETNLLADRLGRIVQTVKSGPRMMSRFNFFLAVMAILVLVLGAYIFHRVLVTRADAEVNNWKYLELGKNNMVSFLGKPTPGEKDADLGNASKIARLQIGRLLLWNLGVHNLGDKRSYMNLPNATEAFKYIENAKNLFESLEKACEKDVQWLSEIKYSLAVIEEVRALKNPQHLELAQSKFKKVATDFSKSNFGPLAEKRADDLEKNAEELKKFYKELGEALSVPPEAMPSVSPGPIAPLPGKGPK